MKTCPICKQELDWLYHRCRFCDTAFCMEHRLPENHKCPGLKEYKKASMPSGGVIYETKNMEIDLRPHPEKEASTPWKFHKKKPLLTRWRKWVRRWIRRNPALAAFGLMLFLCLGVVIWYLLK